jgi:hypothetical protein
MSIGKKMTKGGHSIIVEVDNKAIWAYCEGSPALHYHSKLAFNR